MSTLTEDLFGYKSYTCSACNGSGEHLHEDKSCEECDGTGEIEKTDNEKLANSFGLELSDFSDDGSDLDELRDIMEGN
jgi:uncharacterized phage protein